MDAAVPPSMFRRTPVVTIRASAAAFGPKVWDEERGCLVPFPRRRAPMPVPAA